jgi:hypothetical protein
MQAVLGCYLVHGKERLQREVLGRRGKRKGIERCLMKPKCWQRYVNEVFVILPHEPCAHRGLAFHLNSSHLGKLFSMEVEMDPPTFLSGYPDQLVRRKSLRYAIYKNPVTRRDNEQAASHFTLYHRWPIINTFIGGAKILARRAIKLSNYRMLK